MSWDSQKIEQKRLEHERQRALQRQMFEHQMAMLDRKHQEEEAAIKQQSRAGSRHPSPPATEAGGNSSSAKVPAFGNFDEPEEGLHGSNVPGLRSVPQSRRQSGGEEGRSPMIGSKRAAAGAANGGGPAARDLANAFDAMTVSSPRDGPRSAAQIRAQFEAASSGPNSRSQSPSLAGRQPSGLSRVLASSATGASSPRGDSTPATTEGGGGAAPATGSTFTSVFNEDFLFDDELDAESAFVKKYNLEDDDKFVNRRDSFPGMLSASSAALDLAPLSQGSKRGNSQDGSGGQSKNSEWPQFAPGRSLGQRSAEGEALADRRGQSERNSPTLASQKLPAPNTTGRTSPANAGEADAAGAAAAASGAAGAASGTRREASSNGRLPEGAAESSLRGEGGAASGQGFGFNSFTAGSKSSAATRFGPYAQGAGGFESGNNSTDRTRPSSGYFEAFSSSTNSPSGLLSGSSKYGNVIGQETNKLPPASTAAAAAAAAAAAGLKQTRKGELDVNTKLEDLQGEIFTLCKDQHGCRYLQKKLEEGDETHRDMIFAETFPHFSELMTDPFGNYLCQKMLEFCTDDQRNLIVESVAGELVTISLNMHGTRAVQKTIDFLSTPRQIHSIIVALSMNVVTLIKDLNGNHVIQKCLNRLSAEDNQFIYNAVAAHCVEVATHRHGCCVLQRCIDHASDSQRMQLVAEITFNALTLVQDPFGNYVVQYVLDLNDQRFSDAVIRQFVGNVCALSVQKFSSNVIEKCIRVSDPSIRRQLIAELLNRQRLEKLLRDSFANYVVQTSLDYADPAQRMQLVECIRPILPMIRNTPYGKRIQSKLHRDTFDHHYGGGGGGGGHHHGGHHGGHPGHGGMPYSLLQAAHHQQLQAMAALANRQMGPAEYFNGPGGPVPPGAMPGMPPHMGGMYGGPPPPHGHGGHGHGHGRGGYGQPGPAHMSPGPSFQQFPPQGAPYGPPAHASPMMHPAQVASPGAEMGYQGPGGARYAGGAF